MSKSRIALSLSLLFLALTPLLPAQNGEKAPAEKGEKKEQEKKEFPDFDSVIDKEFQTKSGFFTLYENPKRQELYAAIPKGLVGQEFLLATSVAGGPYRGFQAADWLLRFELHNKQLLLIAPNTQETADGLLQEVVKETYPDALVATVPIATQNGSGDYVIDIKSFLAGNASSLSGFWGGAGGGVVEVAKAKSFEDNTEIALTFLSAYPSGTHFSFSRLRGSKNFKPRVADQRVGYFLTAQMDFSKDERADSTFDRYINRWNLEKADKSLKLSPPVKPIIFYVEKSVPVKYRRWVREGIEMWNKAYEQIGIVNAIEVRQQTDSNEFTGFDPEDSKYNFFRWITSGSAFAMGPSRANPRTGEILDADIIFDESMLRYYLRDFDLLVASLQVDSYSPRMRQYLAEHPWEHPDWPRLREQFLASQRSLPGGAEDGLTPEKWFADTMIGRRSPANNRNFCNLGSELQRQLAFTHVALAVSPAIAEAAVAEAEKKTEDEAEADNGEATESSESASEEAASDDEEKSDDEEEKEEESGDEKGDKEKKKDEKPDPFEEWPEEMVGQILREIVAHEVGHTLGLRHNFKASSWKSIEEIQNTDDPTTATVASVMDYNPLQLNPDGSTPKLWTTPTIGPYDYWAIEYGYAIAGTNGKKGDEDKMLAEIASRSNQPGLDYLTDEDTGGPDPLTFRFDLGSDPMTYAQREMELSRNVTDHILEKFVREGDSYDKARLAYRIALSQFRYAAFITARFIGGHYIHRDQKGTENARPPIEVVEAAKQREAFAMLVKNVFAADAFKIDPVLQQHLAASRWYHWGSNDWFADLTFPVQDMILSVQESILFRLMSMDTVTNLYDAEFRVTAETDLFTLPELLQGLTEAIWSEVGTPPAAEATFSVRKPMISALRRNLQRSYTSELIQMAIRDEDSYYPAISRTLAWKQLKDLSAAIETVLASQGSKLDDYTSAHLEETNSRIKAALEASFQVNNSSGMGSIFFLFGEGPGPSGAGAGPGGGSYGERAPRPNASSGYSPSPYEMMR